MPEDPTGAAQTPPAGGANPGAASGTAGETAADPGGAAGNDEKRFSQTDLNRILRERLAEKDRQTEKQLEEARAKAEQDKLKEQGEYKTLYEKTLAELADLKNQLDSEKLNGMRTRVAVKHKLPEHWIGRLVGATEAELDEDAARLAKDVIPPRAPSTEAGARSSAPMTREEAVKAAREAAIASGRYNRT